MMAEEASLATSSCALGFCSGSCVMAGRTSRCCCCSGGDGGEKVGPLATGSRIDEEADDPRPAATDLFPVLHVLPESRVGPAVCPTLPIALCLFAATALATLLVAWLEGVLDWEWMTKYCASLAESMVSTGLGGIIKLGF